MPARSGRETRSAPSTGPRTWTSFSGGVDHLVDAIPNEKLKVMNSMMGRRPFMAAPIADTGKAKFRDRVSITRCGQNSSSMPWLTL